MIIIDWLRFLFGSAFIILGVVVFAIELVGVFKFKYALNRMHAAALGDTLGIASLTLGLMLFNGLGLTTLKMLLVILFFWFASPACSHLLARMEVTVDEEPDKHYKKKEV